MCFSTTPAMSTVISFQTLLYRLFCIGLAFTMDSSIDLVARIYRLFAKVLYQFRTHHLTDIREFIAGTAVRHIQIDGFSNRLLILTLVQIAQLLHTSSNPVATFEITSRFFYLLISHRRLRYS